MKLSGAAQEIIRYLDDPVAFVREMIGVEPDPMQLEVLRAIAVSPAVAVKSGHGIGKSATAAWVILWFLFTHPFARVPVTAPTMHQLEDVLWPEVAKWLAVSRFADLMEWTKTRLSIRGYEETWFATPRTANKADNLAGFHAEHLLFVVDEASGMAQEIMEVVEGAMTNDGARLLLEGNPTQTSGTFHAAFHRDRALFRTFTFSSANSPRVSPAYVERMARKYGADSNVYRVRVLGEFPRGGADDFIPLSLAESAVNRELPLNRTQPWAIGVDPARFGDDESVLAPACGRWVDPLRGFQGLDGPRLAGEVALLVKDIRRGGYAGKITVRVDETGIGASVYDQLALEADALGIDLVAVNFGGKGDEDHYNTAAALWGEMKRLLPELHLPDDDDLVAQLSCRKYGLTPDGKIRLEEKTAMKKRGISSPDRADAVALALCDPPLRSEARSLWE
jgi:hypothetical protein